MAPPSHSITPGSQLADQGLSIANDVLPVDHNTVFNLTLQDKKEKGEGQDVVQLQLQLILTMASPSHSINHGSQIVDHGLCTLDNVLQVDDDAGLNSIVHDGKE
jgi:hypothetical protein